MSFDFPMVAGDLDWDRPSFVSLCDELDRMIAFPLSEKYGLAHRTRDTLRQLRHLVNIVQDMIQLYGVVHSVVRAANARDAALLAMMAVSGMNQSNDLEHETTAKRLCRDGVQIAQLAYEAAIKNGIAVLMQAHQTSIGLASATRAMNSFISDFVAANEKKRKRNVDDEAATAAAAASTAAPAASATISTSRQ